MSKVKITFMYPNRENKGEIQCSAPIGKSIFDIAKDNHIIMDPKIRLTCLVQIQTEQILAPPTDEETKNLDQEKQLGQGFRYADTYIVDQALNDAIIYLNIMRVYYKSRNGTTTLIYPYLNESMLSVKGRYSEVIDLSFSCHGALACSTCHCVFDVPDQIFSSLGPISDDEEDLMLFADPEKHSRLGCQVQLNSNLDTYTIRNSQAKA